MIFIIGDLAAAERHALLAFCRTKKKEYSDLHNLIKVQRGQLMRDYLGDTPVSNHCLYKHLPLILVQTLERLSKEHNPDKAEALADEVLEVYAKIRYLEKISE